MRNDVYCNERIETKIRDKSELFKLSLAKASAWYDSFVSRGMMKPHNARTPARGSLGRDSV